jgi:hypothetical protein
MAAAVPGSPVKEFDAGKTEYILEKDSNPIPVKIVGLSSSALALFPKSNIATPELITNIALPEPVANIAIPEPIANISIPQSVSSPEPEENRDDDSNAIVESKKGSIRIDRFCDQIVIHIANADNKGYDQIRSEAEKVLTDMLDNYDA